MAGNNVHCAQRERLGGQDRGLEGPPREAPHTGCGRKRGARRRSTDPERARHAPAQRPDPRKEQLIPVFLAGSRHALWKAAHACRGRFASWMRWGGGGMGDGGWDGGGF